MSDGTANAQTLSGAAARRRADRLLLEVARHHSGWTTVTAVSTLAASALVVLLPAALAHAVDAVISNPAPAGASSAEPTRAVLQFGIVLAALTVANLVSEFGQPYCGAAATASLRRRLMDRLLSTGPAATRRFAPGDLVGRLVGAAPDAANAPVAIVNATADLVMSAGGLVALALIDWRLVTAFAVTVPAGALILRSFIRQTGDLAAAYQRTQSEIAARLLDALSGIRTIRASGTRDTEAARVLVPVPELSTVGNALWRAQRVAGWRSMLLFALTQTAVLAVAGFGLTSGRLAVGQVLAAASYAALGLGFFSSTQAALALAQARGAAMRLAETEGLPRMSYGARDLPSSGGGQLEFHRVTVMGTDGPVIENLDLTVPGGVELAVVGASGSGKSVLAALAGRLIDPDAGIVSLDGVALPQLSREALRGAVGYAFERPAPLGETVRETIGLGAERQRVERAATAAAADGFIRKLPEGYDTPLERAPLSGGETQRLGLARALARAGAGLRVIVLDDATAALDTVTEARVGAALESATAGRTRIVIAHRAAAAARADLVAWLENGALRALAPHHELWEEPEYRALLDGEDEPDLGSGREVDGEVEPELGSGRVFGDAGAGHD
ncbi:ABC transporter ATP-binding protein [Actinocrinis sp.]|uniref:ABC transporter ATP-binding protein n=1 Tax=Actinocrinis sp. TaxID=1920516 RepID=UPI002D29137D|nr:ABC transporter ATP-binding protein [Actinocrinis sp.]HZP54955.1 ABC transporter ATP-binding protein [Actinocrinis sp.]